MESLRGRQSIVTLSKTCGKSQRQGLKIACLEEIAYLNRFINEDQLAILASTYSNENSDYLKSLLY